MNKALNLFDEKIKKPIYENEEQLKLYKLENKILIEKYLDKVQKKAIFYQDKNNHLLNKIDVLENKIKFIEAQILLKEVNSNSINNQIIKYQKEIQEISNRYKIQKDNLDKKLIKYSQKIKSEISIFQKNAATKEEKLTKNITEKNRKLIQIQERKYSALRSELEKITIIYEEDSKKMQKEHAMAIAALGKANNLLVEKQSVILNSRFEKASADLSIQYQKKQKAIMKKLQIGNFKLNLQNRLFYKRLDKSLFNWLIKNKLIFLILIFALIVGSIYPRFFHIDNWLNNILRQNIVVGFLAVGMTFIILTGAIDLSVGSTMALSGGIVLYLHTIQGVSFLFSLILGLLISLALSFIMGVLSSYGKLQSFIVTLVGLLVFRGILNLLLKGSPASIRNNEFINFIGSGEILFLPAIVLFFIVITLILMFVLKWTKFGRYIYATGSNQIASKAAGIRSKLIITIVFSLSGLMVYLSSIAYIGNVKSIEPQTGAGYELSAIAAVVLGGTSLSGGEGSIGKTIIGWLLISILNNALIFLRVDSNMQLVFRGIIILLAVLFDNQFNVKNKLKNLVVKARGY